MTKKAEVTKEPKPLEIPNLKVFDVSHPGKSAPSHTARPVIVSNRPILKDPMMVDNPSIEGAVEQTTVSPTATKVVIKPIDHAETDKKENEQVPDQSVDIPADKQPVETGAAAEDSKPDPSTSEPLADETSTEEAPAPERLAKNQPAEEKIPDNPEPVSKEAPKPEESVEPEEPLEPEDNDEPKSESGEEDPKSATKNAKDLTKQEEAAQKAAERQAELDKIIDSRQYYLPVNVVQKRRTALVLSIVVLVLVLAVVGVELAMDAGMLHIDGFQPFTHFFNN